MTTDAIAPTPERVRHAGDQYQPPAETQQVKRAYGRAVPTLDFLRQMERITEEQFLAGDRLRHWLAGKTRPIGLVSSYGQQRWSGTLVSQEISKISVDWPIYCAQKVDEAERTIGNSRTWRLLMCVIAEDMTVEDAGRAVGLKRTRAGQVLRLGLQTLADGDIDKLRPKP